MIARKLLIIGGSQTRLLMIRTTAGTSFCICCRNQLAISSTKRMQQQFRSISNNQSDNEFVKIGTVKAPITRAKNPELVPIGFATGNQPQQFVQHLKWMLQKDALRQDIFLIGPPGFLRANIVFQFLELCNREFEYLAITRDTTEADIKQRREIRAGSAFYTDLCAVKAAINGRILVIDGVEKAERNVLPILNNLLENREMQLDDGRFLMAPDKFDKLLKKFSPEKLREWKLERVSEHFCVICLGLPIPTFQGHSMDPPLRSRFQCRHIAALDFESMRAICEAIAPEVPNWRWANLLSLAYGLNAQWEGNGEMEEKGQSETKRRTTRELPAFPTDNLVKAAQIWNACPALSESSIFQMVYPSAMLKSDIQIPLLEKFKQKFGIDAGARLDIRWDGMEGDGKMGVAEISSENGKCALKVKVPAGNNLSAKASTATKIEPISSSPAPTAAFVSSPEMEHLLAEMLLAHCAADFCILGPRGSGKSTILREFAHKLGYQLETIVLYQDMNSRELLQRRRMLDNGDTVWEDSQLVRAAKAGRLCVLDGVDRVHWSMAESIASLVHHRFLALPDGTRLIGAPTFDAMANNLGLGERELNERKIFRIAENFRIAALGDSDSAPKWLNAQLCSMFMFLPLPQPSMEDKLRLIQQKVPGVSVPNAKKLLKLVERLAHSQDASFRAIASCLSLRRLVHIMHRHSLHPEEGIHDAVQRAALAQFLPPIVRRAFESTLHEIGIGAHHEGRKKEGERKIGHGHEKEKEGGGGWLAKLKREEKKKGDGEEEKEGGLAAEAMIPSTLFFDNPMHLQMMGDMVRDFELGSHLLLIGNQGVGKNKVTDRLLQLLNRPRKYMQLHRDTTIQSLTVQSTVENGRLRFEDSPLVTAVRDGLVLVIDEADKAPLHVVAILKSLLDSEPFYLSDGRRVCPANSKETFGEEANQQEDIYVHPEFRMIMLANRPGFPFLGNDLYALLGDLLAVHALDNPSRESELAMLAQYGPDVPRKTLELLVSIFGDLRQMVDQSLLSYPYSTRELVNIVKHLQKFPNDSLDHAVRNVFDFDSYSADTVELIREAFDRKGVKISIGPSSAQADAYGNWDRILGKFGAGGEGAERIEIERDGQAFDLAKLLDPKFGKIDPSNMPHIGGNQWAGGVGGYSTAGLGGVGGPFRLDAGHAVHQMPENVKRQVPEHILKKAREINRQEYAKRLKEIDMSEYDASAYNDLAARVGKQVRVLRNIIDGLESRQHERQWAKHQTSGDLDDAKLIEGMTGEKAIYRKRVDLPPDPSTQPKPKRIRLCFDVSGSMYRFNGYDNRLQRSLEAALLVMEALDGKTDKIKYDLFGHSGESPAIPFVHANGPPVNEKERLNVLKRMLTHSQFCSSGDYTVEALAMAVKELQAAEMAEQFDERFVILLSDANLDRYGIRPSELRRTLQPADESVNAFIVLIGSLGEQAADLQRALPAGKAFVAMDAGQIPEIMQQIFSSTIVK